ncbi:MAG: NapH/MauN family ferredoxin-type protein [Gammaproteobacteria bacterium]|nr:MAG: NapH/MauN family ferredoxin-type protein [Gammaproteobacteria bacterium]
MGRRLEHVMELLGREPRRPDPKRLPEEVKLIYQEKRSDSTRVQALRAELAQKKANPQPEKIRRLRWAVLIAVNLLFVLSYRIDIQLLEGALTASRFMGFHMADLNASLQVMLAFKHVVVNLLIGTTTVFVLWWLLGGRTFCSWVCPYHLVAEWAEMVHVWLAKKKLVKDHPLDRRLRTVAWVVFAVLAFVTGYTVYETISPTGILSRALIYGPGVALIWVGLLLLFEIFYSRRAWCRYLCPIGLTYGLVGATSPLRVQYHLPTCFHEGECRKVCLVPHVLDTVIMGRARGVHVDIGADCTRCGRCVDACPTGSLTFVYGRGQKGKEGALPPTQGEPAA